MASRNYDRIKRTLDVTVSLILLGVLSVPMIVVGAAIGAALGPPVLFRQARPGQNGHPFTMFKFRTMSDERGADGELLPDSCRMTPLGRFLRRTSLDEVPTLLNVLMGDMSLVGPRPLLIRYTPYFSDVERRRLEVRPGVTGWAQINGRNTASWDRRLAMDVWYVDNRSILLDLRILMLTCLRVVGRSGVVVDPSTAMDDLDVERSRRG